MAPFLLPELTIKGIWIDPQKILDFIELPLDKYEAVIKKDRNMRRRALFRDSLPVIYSEDSNPNPYADPSFGEELRRLAAIILIQAVWRGHRTMRKYSLVRFGESSVFVFDALSRCTTPRATSGDDSEEEAEVDEDPWTAAFHAPLDFDPAPTASRLAKGYQWHTQLCEMLGLPTAPSLREFSALKIQATWKMYVTRKRYRASKVLVQQGIKKPDALLKELKIKEENDQTSAATRIQKFWRRVWNRKIFQILKSFVQTREHDPPHKILRFINPLESQLIDSAAKLHIRLRLGGSDFPPQVYYKLYLHTPTIDLNAFSPRNYVNPLDTEKKTWYKRFENNGWRPIFHLLNPYDVLEDNVYVGTTYRKIEYPPLPSMRREEHIKRRKEKKRAWLRQLYNLHPENPEPMQDLEDDQDMVDWSNALDFDAYLNSWYGIATTVLENRVHTDTLPPNPPPTLMVSELELPKAGIVNDAEHIIPNPPPRLASAKTIRSINSESLYLP